MYSTDDLKARIHDKTLTRTQIALLLLGALGSGSHPVRDVRSAAVAVGRRDVANARRWNLSTILGRSDGLAIRDPTGWELTPAGRATVADLMGVKLAGSATRVVASNLRGQLKLVTNEDVRAFLVEAVECFESGHYRSAVVLSWVGAVAMLHDHVVAVHLAAFNAEASRRDKKWKSAKTADDLGRMKEHDFLNVLEALSVVGKNVKQELQNSCLALRNGCGHPNSMIVGENRVAAHIEFLIDNVYTKF